jgi:hypothetical protein
MRCAPLLSSIVTFFLLIPFARALERTDSARELKQLQEQHQKDAAAALEPVNKRYASALEQLLRRAVQANDQDTAKAIRAELEKYGITASTTGAGGNSPLGQTDEARKNALRAHLRDTKWSLSGGRTFELKPDGTTTASWHRHVGFWKVVGPNTVEMATSNAGTVRKTTFDDDLTTATMAAEKGMAEEAAHRVPTGK